VREKIIVLLRIRDGYKFIIPNSSFHTKTAKRQEDRQRNDFRSIETKMKYFLNSNSY